MEIEALSRGQSLLLQRLMAVHAMSDHQAQKIFQDLRNIDNEDMGGSTTLEHCFGKINRQLTKAFYLEIASISMQQHQQQRFHAVINQHADDIAKKSFMSPTDNNNSKKWNSFSRTPSEHEYVRQVLQCLVEREGYSAPRVDLINIKNNIKAPYKITMEGAEHCLKHLLDEYWLMYSESSEKGQPRREKLSTKIELGPRAYLELPQLLIEFGMSKDDIPQTIFHRAQ